MSLISNIEKFNTHSMSEESVLTLVTGRDKLIQNISLIIDENIKQPSTIQHLVLIGPRGMGKSFLLRYFQIITKNTSDDYIDFSLLPEEQHNINSASEFIDELIARIDNTGFYSKPSLWDNKNENWESSVNTLKTVIEKKKEEHKNYLFVAAVENIDILLGSVFRSKVDESRFRKLLSSMPNFMLFATSLKFDIDTDYNKRLFNAFQKLHVESWTEEDYLHYFSKRFELLKQQNPAVYNQKDIGLLTNKLKAIAQFTGGSPRMAVVLTNLIFNDDAISTAKTLNDIVEDLSPYYQDLMSKMPTKSKILFDALIQEKENISQSDLANMVGTKQATISQAFKWLLENNYINGHKVSGEKQYRYSVADRIFVLFYFKRYVYCGLECSYMRILSDFLISFYNTKELSRNTIKYLQNGNKAEGVELARMVFQKTGHDYNKINWENHKEVENEINRVINKEEIKDLFSAAENKLLEKDYQEALKIHQNTLGMAIREQDILSQARCYEKIGIDYLKLKDSNLSIESLQNALTIWEKEGNLKEQASVLNLLSFNFDVLNETTKAIQFCQEALSIYYNLKDLSGQALSLEILGLYYSKCEDFEKAIEFHKKSLLLMEQEKDILGQARNLELLGLNFNEIQDYAKAIEFHIKALSLMEQEKDTLGQARNLEELGLNFNRINDYAKAIEFHTKALSLMEKEKDILGQARNFEQLGLNFNEIQDYVKAIEFQIKALSTWKQVGDIYRQAKNCSLLSLTYGEISNFTKAIEFGKKARSFWKHEKLLIGEMLTLRVIGFNYTELKLFGKAVEYYLKALEISLVNDTVSNQASDLGKICVNYFLDNSDKGLVLIEQEKYGKIPKELIIKEFGNAVIYKKRWEDNARAFEMANNFLYTIKTKDWKFDRNKAVSNFFAGLLNMKLPFDLLKDICNEAKGMFGNEGDIIVDAVQHCMTYIENRKDSNYLLKINPDMAIVVRAIIEEAEI